MWERTELLIQTSFCENIAQLNLLFVLMLAYVRYPSIYGVAIGDYCQRVSRTKSVVYAEKISSAPEKKATQAAYHVTSRTNESACFDMRCH